MQRSSRRAALASQLAIALLAACSTRTREPDPGSVRAATQAEGSGAPAGAVAADSGGRRHTAADVRFMQHMIAHHGQALVMTDLAPTRAGREEIRRIAERIAVSQKDEIAFIRRWLERRGEAVPSLDTAPQGQVAPGGGGGHEGHHGAPGTTGSAGDHATMPGMLTAEELARLTAATGAEFDRLFLQYMIRHHEGAIAMVAELLATPGAGQEVELFRFASDVDADQRAEIRRMRMLQDAPSGGAPRR